MITVPIAIFTFHDHICGLTTHSFLRFTFRDSIFRGCGNSRQLLAGEHWIMLVIRAFPSFLVGSRLAYPLLLGSSLEN